MEGLPEVLDERDELSYFYSIINEEIISSVAA